MNSFNHFLTSFFILMLLSPQLRAETTIPDSIQRESARKWSLKSTARLHSRGMFAYGGRIVSKHPAFDVHFNYARKHWGFQAFKALDLVDQTSANNFMLAVFYKNFKLGNVITVTPHVGAFLEQPHHFAGHGSDVAFVNVTTFKVSSHLSLEHTLLFGNMVLEPALRDWVNRARVLYTHDHWDIIGTVWHNNKVFDQSSYLSSGLQVMYSRVKLSDSFNLSIGLTELSVLQSSNEQSVAKDHQCLATVIFQLVQ